MIKFYCLKTCSTCKRAEKFLIDNNISYTTIDIRNTKFNIEDIEYIHKKSNKDIKKLFNTSGIIYRSLKLKDKIKTMSLLEKYEILTTDGMLLKRPILITDNKVYIGFKETEYGELCIHK